MGSDESVGTMIHVNPSRVQNRRACNRCHQAKLKCVLEGGGRKCERCKRTKTECIFNPPTRIQRQQNQPRSSLSTPSSIPSSTPSRSTDYHLNSWSNVDIDWEVPLEPSLMATFDLDMDLYLANGLPASLPGSNSFNFENRNCKQNSAAQSTGHDGLLTPMILSATSSIGTTFGPSMLGMGTHAGYDESQVSRLPASSGHAPSRHDSTIDTMLPSLETETEDLDDQLTALAFWADKLMPLNVQFTQHLQSIPRINLESLHNDNNNGVIPTPKRSHNSDQTFDLSESFINMLSSMCSKLPPPQARTAINEGCTTTYLLLDESSYLLVFSTYLRFLETHDTVFRYLLACLVHKRESTATRSCFYLPKLSMGSFSLAKTSETRPLLFVNIMESMLARAKNLIHRLASVKAISANRSFQECFGDLSPLWSPPSLFKLYKEGRPLYSA